MERIIVNLKDHSYSILIEEDIIKKLQEYINTKHAVIITDSNVDKIYGNIINTALKGSVTKYIIPAGEASKKLKTIENIIEYLIINNTTRKSIILAFGGGVVGDIAGFAASIYMRGIDYYQIPTTLLAQVDSSVGGKTAVNMSLGKNLIGTFHQPKGVFIDPQLLMTLSKEELIGGLGEVIKYGLIYDGTFFNYVANNIHKALALDMNIISYIIKRCCEIKAEIVSLDEKEIGIRKILNFGHTIGHGIETITEYKHYTHGQAVLLGILYESKLAKKLGLINHEQFKKISSLIKGFNIKGIETYSIQQLLTAILKDKKNNRGNISFILPKGLGEVDEFTFAVEEVKGYLHTIMGGD